MPDEREMAEINEAMQPQESPELRPRAERRRITREEPVPGRITGIRWCTFCGFELELDREPIPEHCPQCAFPGYEEGETATDEAEGIALSRRHSSAIESVAGAIERGVDVFTDFKDLIGEIAEALAQRVGKAGR